MASQIFRPMTFKTTDDKNLFLIPSNYFYKDVTRALTQSIEDFDQKTFERAAKIAKYDDLTLKHGRYRIPQNASYFDLVRFLRSGAQEPVNVVINNVRTIDQLAGKTAAYLESDSIDFLSAFTDSQTLEELGVNVQTLMTIFIPNTYQFLWTTRPEAFLKRMKSEHDKFWNTNDRIEKAKNLNLSPTEVYILASIVERESQVQSERPTIAGLYLNRLRKNMRLQADPTVVFAMQDFTIKRVLNKHLVFESPYNTYLYEGLPPGPICMASINSIDAVLNADEHNYLYMCAAPDTSGKHVFAETLTQHNINANAYRRFLNKMGIR